MRLLKLVIEEERMLVQNWQDDTGRSYCMNRLRPIENCAEELRDILSRFENSLPRAPQRW